MDPRHVPTKSELFQYDLENGSVVTVRCRDGNSQDCLLASGDRMGLVLKPSLVWINHYNAGVRSQMNWMGLDEAISVEFNRGSTQEVRWVRDPDGLWLRLSDLER